MPIMPQKTKLPQIDRNKVLAKEFHQLTPHEKRWLQDTEFWPEGEPKAPVTFRNADGTEISNDPAFLMASGNNEALDRLVEARAQELLALKLAEDDLDIPPPGIREVNYENMSVQELRGEALRRGLSIEGPDGNKKNGNLITNIEAWDEEHPEGIDAFEAAKGD